MKVGLVVLGVMADDSFQSLVPESWIDQDSLPVVLGALSSVLGMLGGVVDGLHDVGVPGVEGDGLDELGHLVPELGGGEVVVSLRGRFTCGSGDAAQLGLISTSVQQEAHTSSKICWTDRGWLVITSTSYSSSAHQSEYNDGNLEGNEDDEVGEVKAENLTAC